VLAEMYRPAEPGRLSLPIGTQRLIRGVQGLRAGLPSWRQRRCWSH